MQTSLGHHLVLLAGHRCRTHRLLRYASTSPQAEAAGEKILMMTGNPDRLVEFVGSGQPHFSKRFPPEGFRNELKKSFRQAARIGVI